MCIIKKNSDDSDGVGQGGSSTDGDAGGGMGERIDSSSCVPARPSSPENTKNAERVVSKTEPVN